MPRLLEAFEEDYAGPTYRFRSPGKLAYVRAKALNERMSQFPAIGVLSVK